MWNSCTTVFSRNSKSKRRQRTEDFRRKAEKGENARMYHSVPPGWLLPDVVDELNYLTNTTPTV